MNKELTKKIAKNELKNRIVKIIPNVLESAFKEQLDFINDPSKQKAACSSRRAGKSSAVGLYLVHECLQNPRTNCLYIARTKESAENIMWNDVFDTVLKKYNIDAKPGTSKLQIKFNNGSILYLTGADASETQMRNLVGKKYSLVVIDECQNFTNDLSMLVNKVLKPTLGDLNATIAMIGTPGNNMTDASYWYKVAQNKEPGWSVHEWHWKQNPHVRDNIQLQVTEMLNNNPLISLTPWFRMEYNNEWVPESDARVYKSQDSNYINSLPPNFLKGATYLLSIDLGYLPDPTAFVIGAYNKRYSDKLYILESYKKEELTITAVANIIKEYQKKYHFRSIYADAANKQAVEEMRQIHNLPLQAAEKLGKEGHIALLNSDFITQNIFILKDGNAALIDELNKLIWNAKDLLKGKHKENAINANHLTDSLLYCHHGSRHYWYKPKVELPEPEEQFMQAIEKQFNKSINKGKTLKLPFWEDSE